MSNMGSANNYSNMTEEELRDVKDPQPHSIEDLNSITQALVDRQHDYGTCVYAMSLSAIAAFNYVAGELGVTGFQASCADLDFIRRSRSIEGPFMIMTLKDSLYPQYDLQGRVQEFIDSNAKWRKEQAQKLLAEDKDFVHPDVLAHWMELAHLVVPEEMKHE